MKISNVIGSALVIFFLLLLVACNGDNDDRAPATEENNMTPEKMELISVTIEEMVKSGNLPSEGRLVISDQTAMSEQVESYMRSNDSLNSATALDYVFPYDFLPWSIEESDQAFIRYYEQNLEPVEVRLEHLQVLDRDVSILMHERFKQYLAEDQQTDWDAFFADYPDAVGYMRLGNPVIFESYGFALVHLDFICGSFCGIGYYGFFRKENNEWKFETWYADWVS